MNTDDQVTTKSIPVSGVPFFIVHEKTVALPALSSDSFQDGLERAWAEYEKEYSILFPSKIRRAHRQ
jgi:predicted DsbA family dithiol-disulfide isomerase